MVLGDIQSLQRLIVNYSTININNRTIIDTITDTILNIMINICY